MVSKKEGKLGEKTERSPIRLQLRKEQANTAHASKSSKHEWIRISTDIIPYTRRRTGQAKEANNTACIPQGLGWVVVKSVVYVLKWIEGHQSKENTRRKTE